MIISELDPLDTIIKRRRGGSDNIRGIRYQVLYSVRHSLALLFDSGARSVRLEGAEDFDYVKVESENVYVQIKTSRSSRPWTLSSLEKPFKSFLELHRTSPNAQFVLAVDFSPRNELQRLFERELLDEDQRNHIDQKFLDQIAPKLSASRTEVENLLNSVRFESTPEHELERELLAAVCSIREMGPGRAAIHIGALVYQFMIWAEAKATLTKHELAHVLDGTERVIAQSHPDYDAFNKHLLDAVSWATEGSHSDYFEGKAARPDHIGAGLDVRRQKWMDRIDGILSGRDSKVCILRASSGQGKSTLMYRYAHDYWDHSYILRINLLETPQNAADINYYLRDRATLGRPYLILIDGIDASKRYWFEVAQECASLGFPMIATVRHEDWFQYGGEHVVAYQPLEPFIDLDEARAVYTSLQKANALAVAAPAPEVAFEQAGAPPLLIEYVFLITQGKILEDRIRDQLRSIGQSRDAAAKKRMLRNIALAHTLGVPLDTLRTIAGGPVQGDPADVLTSLIHEYLHVERGRASGVHWVRSAHLSRILHETLRDEHQTILEILKLDAVPSEHLPTFIGNALSQPEIDAIQLLASLILWTKEQSTRTALGVIEGVFNAGERRFMANCRPLLDEAQSRSWGLRWIASTDLAPRSKLDSLSRFAELLGDASGEVHRLAEKVPQLRQMERGEDLVRQFLIEVLSELNRDQISREPAELGQLLGWCALAKVQMQSLGAAAVDSTQGNASILELSVTELANFAFGIYQYDKAAYYEWYRQQENEILSFLRFHLDCIDISIVGNELHAKFIVDSESDTTLNDQAMNRLHLLRSVLPFCERYCSQGSSVLPYGLSPSVDDTHKSIPAANLPPESDVRLNVTWDELVEAAYSTDSIYRFQEAWYEARKTSLQYVRRLVQALRRHGQGALPGELLANQASGSLLTTILTHLRQLPPVPPQAPRSAKEAFRTPQNENRPVPVFARVDAQKWCQSLQNFASSARRYVDRSEDRAARLIVVNFFDAHFALPALHAAFAELFQASTDYFQAERLNVDEMKEYGVLADLLEIVLLDPPPTPQKNLLRFAICRKEEDARQRFESLHAALSAQQSVDIEIGVPSDVIRRGLQVTLPFTFSVQNPCDMNLERDAIHGALIECLVIADRFLMIPVYKGTLLDNVAFVIFQHQLKQLAEAQDIQWEFYIPHSIDSEVLALFPNTLISPPIEYQMRQKYEEVLLRTEMLSRTAQLITPLSASLYRFDRELASKHAARLDTEKSRIADMIELLIRQVASHYKRDESSKDVILRTLGEAQGFVLASGVNSLNMRFEADMQSQNQVATRFFCSSLD